MLARLAVGGLPATPIMRWLQERGGPLERFSQAMLLRVPAGLAAGSIWRRRLRRCWIITTRCGCGSMRAADAAERRLRTGGLRCAAGGGCGRRPACGGSMSAVVDDGGVARADRGGGGRLRSGRLDPAAGVMVQAVWFDAGAARAGRLLADDPSSCGRWGVVADPGAGPCGGLAGDRGRAGGCAAAAGDVVPALGGAACGACAGRQRCAGAFVLARDAERAVAAAGRRSGSMRCATRWARPGI